MIKSIDDKPTGPREIDLTGPDGNVFMLMAYAKRLAKEIYNDKHPVLKISNEIAELLDGLDAPSEEFKPANNLGEFICNKMKESDYDNAVKVFDHYFGDYVILYR